MFKELFQIDMRKKRLDAYSQEFLDSISKVRVLKESSYVIFISNKMKDLETPCICSLSWVHLMYNNQYIFTSLFYTKQTGQIQREDDKQINHGVSTSLHVSTSP